MLETALARRDYLERLAEAPAWKRTLIDDLGDSRSTVDRAVETLQDVGLVERTEDGFRTTYAGRVLLDTATEASGGAADGGAAGESSPATSADGPGFGILAALAAGAARVGVAADRLRQRDEE